LQTAGELERKYVLRSWAVQGRNCTGSALEWARLSNYGLNQRMPERKRFIRIVEENKNLNFRRSYEY